jgi:hypothetical protein
MMAGLGDIDLKTGNGECLESSQCYLFKLFGIFLITCIMSIQTNNFNHELTTFTAIHKLNYFLLSSDN